jgi:hypothetical protein
MNLPDYHFFPAPLWLLTTLHVVTLTLHFIAMNFVFGGLVVILFGRFENKWTNPTVKRFVQLFPTIMAATVTFGVAPLLFLQVVYPAQVYSASITSAWFWLLVPIVAMLAYYAFYTAVFGSREGRENRTIWLALALAGLIFISLVYSSVFALAENPKLIAALYASRQNGLVVNSSFTWLVRWSHMVLGAVGIGGFFVMILGRDENARLTGKQFFLGAMIAAMIAGLGYLFTLGDAVPGLMQSPAIWALFVAIVLALGALHFGAKGKPVPAALLLFLSMLGMVTTRHTIRLIELGDRIDLASVPIRPPWDVFAIFLACFLAALALVAWMLKLFFHVGSRKAA